MRPSKKKDDETSATVDAGAAPPAPAADDRNVVLLDAHRNPVYRVKGDQSFRITVGGRVYEHCGEDTEGRWLYAPMP